MNEFEEKILVMLGKVIDKLNEHDKRFDTVDKRFDTVDKRFDTVENKLNAIAEQTAKNTEFNTIVKAKHEQLENEITEIKKRLEV